MSRWQSVDEINAQLRRLTEEVRRLRSDVNTKLSVRRERFRGAEKAPRSTANEKAGGEKKR
jgi:hypothetical protein